MGKRSWLFSRQSPGAKASRSEGRDEQQKLFYINNPCITDLKDYLPLLQKFMYNRFNLLIDSYAETKVGIDTGFITEALCDGLYQNILNLQKDNLMVEGGIGNSPVAGIRQEMRGDTIYWMDKEHDNIFEQEFLHHAEEFIRQLNRTCYTGINGFEFHYAVYENGAGYKRHKDQFKNDSKRKFSLIHYLNKDWVEEDGGHLIIYKDRDLQQVPPKSQTAVFFKSDEMEHEVMKANKPRMSITGWLKRV